MPRPLLTFQSKKENYTCDVIPHSDGSISFIGDFDIDCDGSGGNPHHDRYFAPDTTLHFGGKALNAEVVPFIVIPPEIIKSLPGIFLGAKARITNLRNGKTCDCVVGDVGPHFKAGEGSPAAAETVGIDSNPNTGGEDEPRVLFEVWPDVPAVLEINGLPTTFTLQPYK